MAKKKKKEKDIDMDVIYDVFSAEMCQRKFVVAKQKKRETVFRLPFALPYFTT